MLNKRTLATISVVSLFAILITTSILMFTQAYTTTVALTHTVLGFTFIGFGVWHGVNNFSAIKKYLSFSTPSKAKAKHGLPSITAVGLTTSLLVLCLVSFPPFLALHFWGTQLRISDNNATQASELKYNVLNMAQNFDGRSITIDFKKGTAFHWPQYAMWLEDESGEIVQAVYVTQGVGTNTFKNTVTLNNSELTLSRNPFDDEGFVFESIFSEDYDESRSNNKFRPEALPIFLHRFVKDIDVSETLPQLKLDGYTGATQFENHILTQKVTDESRQRYNIYFEINQSFDFNQYYSSDRFPDDAIYSGDGFSAQPSVLYHATIDFSSDQKFYAMSLVGHGHHSGRDGEIYTNMENLTTAKNIVDRIIIDLRQN
ncbi:hypothetical protein KO528_00055 [Saccharophagus degradans]|uniref:hypothetical protein n=1 Tax=Saccharophagus degradans TaxID=86304 RepID=UPI001C086B3D|nr:hypothetical protein [Saccharophagus degradans]MBU2983727.1 hypothetical protein [Saccharophagus degradans]